jgi:voltage-dependent calcium channel alpha-2/delta-3
LQGGDKISCEDDSVECYVLDNNGFVVISEDKLNTGKFFGEIDGTVLNSLVKNNVFKRIKIFDYQVFFKSPFLLQKWYIRRFLEERLIVL